MTHSKLPFHIEFKLDHYDSLMIAFQANKEIYLKNLKGMERQLRIRDAIEEGYKWGCNNHQKLVDMLRLFVNRECKEEYDWPLEEQEKAKILLKELGEK